VADDATGEKGTDSCHRTRSVSARAAASRASNTGPSGSRPDASCRSVIPWLAAARDSSSMRRAISAAVGDGTNRDTSPAAASLSSPVGEPSRSRSITPRGGSGVAAVTLAARSAALLASDWCPSRSAISTGCVGNAASRYRLCGALPGKSDGVHPRPVIHAVGGRVAAHALRRRTISAGAPASTRSARACVGRCQWLSLNPGTTRRPRSGTTRVAGPTSVRMALSDPTATTRPSRTASAWASGAPGSPVEMRPPR
jgi:hypothetical protein